MKQLIYIVIVSIVLVSCGSRKKIVTKRSDRETEVEVVKTTEEKKQPSKKSEPKTKTSVPSSTQAYIDRYKPIAIAEMRKYGIPASITLAQGILESGSGKGRLAVKANNHFGIKCHGWKGAKIYHDDDRAQECFRKYKDASYSFRDHSEFLANRKGYARLFELKLTDYKGWARELRKAGYATDKKYPEKLISIIERYGLYEYDGGKIDQEVVVEVPLEHVVKKGDTLYSISKRYDIDLDHLKKINGMDSSDISIGQVIYLKRRE